MDSLFKKAEAVNPHKKQPYKRKTRHDDYTAQSVSKHTSIPKSLTASTSTSIDQQQPKFKHIQNKKLRGELEKQSQQNARAKAMLEDSEMLLVGSEVGKIEVQGEMERTWRVGQNEIVSEVGQEAVKGRREFKLDGGPYRLRYTRNGR